MNGTLLGDRRLSMPMIGSFRELDVYQLARDAAKAIFQVSRRFPRDEQFSLTDQIRRASRAVCAMIAEAWGRRRYVAAFVNKLNEAVAESMETQAWLDSALDCGYITAVQHRELNTTWLFIGGKLNRMIDLAHKFCPRADKARR